MYWNVSVRLKCVRTSRIESLLNLTPLYTFVSKNVVSVSDISAVNLIVEFNFNSHVFHVMYQETRFLNQDACFFKSRRETTIFDPFCFRGGLKPSTRVGIQGLKVLTGLHDPCSSQIDWSLKTMAL